MRRSTGGHAHVTACASPALSCGLPCTTRPPPGAADDLHGRQACGRRRGRGRSGRARPSRRPPLAVLADSQRRRTVSTARIDGAVAGTPFFIALVPAYIAFLRQEVRFHLRVAALYGNDPADPQVAADFLVLRGVHKDSENALAELEVVRANPLPPQRKHTPLKSWYQAVVSVLILAGFMSAPEENGADTLDRRAEGVACGALRRGGGDLGADLGRPGHLHDRHVLGVRERRTPVRPTRHDALRRRRRRHHVAMARADRKAGGNRAVTVARGALVVLSVALPLALIASTVLAGNGPLGVHVPQAAGALAALALVIGVSVAAIRG